MDKTTDQSTPSRSKDRTSRLTMRIRTQLGVMRHLPGIVAAALLVGGGIAQAAPAVPVHGVYETEAGEKHTLYAVAREDEEATRWMADGRRVLHVLVTHEADSLNRGTASHYFAFNPEKLEKRKRLRLDALRFTPTRGYIIIDDKEYMLTEILITLTDGKNGVCARQNFRARDSFRHLSRESSGRPSSHRCRWDQKPKPSLIR